MILKQCKSSKKNDNSKDCGWCGKYSVPFRMLTTEKTFQKINSTLKGELVGYSDSLSSGTIPLKGVNMGVTNVFHIDHWVGHLAVAYYMD